MIAPEFPSRAADHRTWGQLHGSSDALAICESARAHKGLTLVITRSTADAIRLEQAMRFFLGLPPEEDGPAISEDGLELLSLPDWETLPTICSLPIRTSSPGESGHCTACPRPAMGFWWFLQEP